MVYVLKCIEKLFLSINGLQFCQLIHFGYFFLIFLLPSHMCQLNGISGIYSSNALVEKKLYRFCYIRWCFLEREGEMNKEEQLDRIILEISGNLFSSIKGVLNMWHERCKANHISIEWTWKICLHPGKIRTASLMRIYFPEIINTK